ncbi:class I SAM-dependent methyltransferase [Frankia sp. CcI49]|uniref:class I SAM-dependent methyltransferase n=1 Tax=Frankia sp. CcI49 TaxID=1745382 RepID=UPI001F51E7AB|nr:class I SAM-dependent methyltransferase [Frankia sp. CcI49]
MTSEADDTADTEGMSPDPRPSPSPGSAAGASGTAGAPEPSGPGDTERSWFRPPPSQSDPLWTSLLPSVSPPSPPAGPPPPTGPRPPAGPPSASVPPAGPPSGPLPVRSSASSASSAPRPPAATPPAPSPPEMSVFTPRSARRAAENAPAQPSSPGGPVTAPLPLPGYPVTPGTSATFEPPRDPREFRDARDRTHDRPDRRHPDPSRPDPSRPDLGRPDPGPPGLDRPGFDRPDLDRADPGRAPFDGAPFDRAPAGRAEPAPDAPRQPAETSSPPGTSGSTETSSVVHGSLAELAVDAYDGGDHAAEPGEITEKTLAPLLLHSLTDLREIWIPLLEAAGARSVAEIGSESGATTSLLVGLLRRGGGGRLVVIDPEPGVTPTSGGGLDVEVIRGFSPEALDGHAPTDAYLVDGDHNYATVRGELAAIAAAVRDFDRAYFPLVILHDVGWPAGRRDQYYAPDRIPEEQRQPNSWDVGVEIDKSDAIPGRGFRGAGAFAWALTEGGPRNGVRTAVEDFAMDHPDLRFITVAPIFGLGVLLDRRAPWARHIADLLAPWVANSLLARMERNRIDLYLRVLAMQDDAAAAARARQREWSRIDAERSELAARDLQRLSRISELEQELAVARREQQRPPWGPGTPDEPRLLTAARIAGAALRARLGGEAGVRDSGDSGDGAAGSTAIPSRGAQALAAGTRTGGAAVVRLGSGLARLVENRSTGGTPNSSRHRGH